MLRGVGGREEGWGGKVGREEEKPPQVCFYKTSNPPLRKADHLGLAIRDMVHGVWLAIGYSYKLGQKNEFKF